MNKFYKKLFSAVVFLVIFLVVFVYFLQTQQKPNGPTSNENRNITFDAESGDYGINFFDIENEEVRVYDSGNEIASLSEDRLELTDDSYALESLAWSNSGSIWFGAKLGIQLIHVYSYDPSTDSLEMFDVTELNMTSDECALNPATKMIVYSDYNFAFEIQDDETLSDIPNNLYIYDLESEEKELVMSSESRHRFNPTWINDNTVEYIDPKTGKRIQKNWK